MIIVVPSNAPVHLQGNAVNSTTVQLQWKPPAVADQNGVIRSYRINISVAETGSVFQLTSGTTALNISGLHPYYTYNLTVAAVTIGPGPFGVVLTIQLPENGLDANCIVVVANFLKCNAIHSLANTIAITI